METAKGCDDDALAWLLRAEVDGPEAVQNHVSAQEITRMLVHRARRRPDGLIGLADRLGVA